jgi:hypothetical protein
MRCECTPSKGQVRGHSVLTWLGQEKAIALAVQHEESRRRDDRLYDVEATELGPAPRNANGTLDVAQDLHDRMEF